MWSADQMEKDVKAVLEGKPLAPMDKRLLLAWSEADKESTRSL